MRVVNLHAAKTHLSRLVQDAAEGQEIIIAKAGVPIARLVPVDAGTTPRRPGELKGRLRIGSDFDAPLPDGVAEAFGTCAW
jgi:prevent-host-death family protein